MVAAAAASLLSVTIRSGLFLVVSQRLHSIPYELGRLLQLAAVALGLYLLARQVPGDSLVVKLVIRGAIACSLVPVLCLLRFFSLAELSGARGLLPQRSTT
jgi:hypothetical protein